MGNAEGHQIAILEIIVILEYANRLNWLEQVAQVMRRVEEQACVLTLTLLAPKVYAWEFYK